LPSVVRDRRAVVLLPSAVYLVGIAATFLALVSIQAPSEADRTFFLQYWDRAFPPVGDLGRLAGWLLATHTGYMFAYPEGGERGASGFTTLLFVAGAVALRRRGRGTVLALALLPFVLGLAASALRRYPYGMSNRTMQYLAPSICLLAGLGAASLLGLIRDPRDRFRTLAGVCLGLAAYGLICNAGAQRHPYRLATEERTREFARWFWLEKSRDAELICARTDLGIAIRPGHWEGDHATTYLCLQRIYSPRHARGESPRFGSISTARPLRVVFFDEAPEPGRDPKYDAWLAEVADRLDLRSAETFSVTPVDGRPGETARALYHVLEWVPKPPGSKD
jgi:hypothetical protein